jgi:hypothetical protein
VDIFQVEKVKRLKPDNFAIALVKRDDLERCLRESNLSISALVQDVNLPALQVPEGVSFRVLDGRHRLFPFPGGSLAGLLTTLEARAA